MINLWEKCNSNNHINHDPEEGAFSINVFFINMQKLYVHIFTLSTSYQLYTSVTRHLTLTLLPCKKWIYTSPSFLIGFKKQTLWNYILHAPLDMLRLYWVELSQICYFNGISHYISLQKNLPLISNFMKLFTFMHEPNKFSLTCTCVLSHWTPFKGYQTTAEIGKDHCCTDKTLKNTLIKAKTGIKQFRSISKIM